MGISKKTINLVLVFSFFFFLPCGWSKHWLMEQSLVMGVLVDYLMPDLWLVDIIAFLIIALNFNKKLIKKDWLWFLLLFVLSFFSQIPLVSAINLIRVAQAILLIKIISENKKDFKNSVLLGLGLAITYTFLIALAQLVFQKTAFGWWFLGEPIFSKGSGGVKTIDLFNLSAVLPMATLPHSNVLGAFGVLGFYVFLKNNKSIWQKVCLILSLILVFVSFSLISCLGFLMIILFDKKTIKVFGNKRFLVLFLLLPVMFIIPASSFYRRCQLAIISLKMLVKFPLFGVGLGTFVKSLPGFWQERIGFRFLQPVHNVFLLMFSETGLIGVLCFFKFLKEPVAKVFKKNKLFLILFLLFGFFDHFLLTTAQGIYFFTLLALI